MRHAKPRDFQKLFTKKKRKSNNISLEEFYQYFSTLQNDLPNATEAESEEFCDCNDFDTADYNYQELDKPITVQEIESAIRALKRQKAFAGDMLINEYYIESMDILASHLVDIFNAILNSGYFPSNWSKGIIVPVF